MQTNTYLPSVMAETALRLVKNCFDKVPGEDRRCFRFKNLTPSETIVKFMDLWESNATEIGYPDVRVVVSSDGNLSVPSHFRAEPDKSITYYRNNNTKGLIYLETSVQSDEQGLKNIFTLKDNNFLDGSFDDDSFNTKDQLLKSSWKALGKQEETFPVFAAQCIKDVLEAVHPSLISIPVRKFIIFALHTLSDWDEVRTESGGALEPERTLEIVGRNLMHIGMFPDEYWRQYDSDTRVSRRLYLNSLHADLSSSATTDLDADKLVDKCVQTRFTDEDGNIYDIEKLSHWRDLCAKYCVTPKEELRAQIPYRIFEQLFAPDSVGLKLGERVHQEILNGNPDRVPELTSLNVISALDRRSQDDALRFLEAVPSDEALPLLYTLLSNQTKRMVEKLAYPTNERFFNPLSKLAEVAKSLLGRTEGDLSDLTIELSFLDLKHADNPSVGLFAFLFGRTLAGVMEASSENTFGAKLVVAEELLKIIVPPIFSEMDDSDDSEDIEGIKWEPVSVVFRLISADGTELDSESGLEWFPDNVEHFATAWMFLADTDTPLYESTMMLTGGVLYNEWVDLACRRLASITSIKAGMYSDKCLADPVFQKAREIRNDFKSKVRKEGLSYRIALDQFDQSLEVLELAKTEFVPNGESDERLSAYLSLDSISIGSENAVVILPWHPAKLRWLGHYLRKSEELAFKSLSGDLPLNTSNERMYLDWFASLTPHKQPTVAVDRKYNLLSPAREIAWHDYCFPILNAVGDGSLDTTTVLEISNQLNSYMLSHPHKRDGLSLLILCPHMAELPADLLREFRKGDWKDVRTTVHVVAHRENWEKLTDQFEGLTTESRMNISRELFPAVQLRLYEYIADKTLNDIVDDQAFDIGIIPNFLHDKISVQFNTDPPIDFQGQFDPLLDRPTHVHGGLGSGYVSVSMRPRSPDDAMSKWSTLCVRNTLGSPVSPTQKENQDFANLRIDFEDASRLFSAFHEKCHWVITVEEHITREQIEHLEGGPDILSVRDGIGSGGLYTLIVSSNSGHKFIVERLDRKLQKFIPKNSLDGREAGFTRRLAEHVYEEIRSIAPRLALQAMGVSRVTEEILGVSIAKHMAEEQFPAKPKEGFVGWISLDDHLEWFNGPSSTRADLCRFTFEVVEGEIHVDLLVVEGKMRQQYDAHGLEQVKATIGLLKKAVFKDPDGVVPEDVGLWREKFLIAIESSSDQARKVFGREDDEGTSLIPLDIRQAFRNGNYNLRSMKGLYSICRYDQSNSKKEETMDEVKIVHTFNNHIMQMIEMEDISSDNNTDNENKFENSKNPLPEGEGRQSDNSGIQNSVSPSEAKMENITIPKTGSRGMDPELLATRYQMILDKFGEFSISVIAPSSIEERYVEGPASILYRLKPGQGVSPSRLSAQADALKLALGLSEDQNLRFIIDSGFMTIDVPKTTSERYFVSAEKLWENWQKPENELQVVIGEDRFGAPITLNFSSSNTPHLLIGGTTGSGKSEALNTILHGIVKFYDPSQLRLFLVDPKGTELQSFEESPCLGTAIGWDDQDAISMLSGCVDEMQSRYNLMKAAKVRSLPEYNKLLDAGEGIPWWVVVLDEYADLTSDPDAKKQIEDHLKRLAQKARAAGIHVIIATQNPKADVISTNLRSNLPAQLALKVKSSTESRVIMDEVGAESLNGMGDAFLKTASGTKRVQCAKVESDFE